MVWEGPLVLVVGDLSRHLGAANILVAGVGHEQLQKAKISNIGAIIAQASQDIEKEIDKLTDGLGVDLVVTAVPAPAAQQMALKVVAKKGKVNFFGGLPRDEAIVELDTNLIHYKEITVVGTHGSAPRHVAKAMELSTQGHIDLGK